MQLQLPTIVPVQKIRKRGAVDRRLRLGMEIAETLNRASSLLQQLAIAEPPKEADRLRRMAFSLDQTANCFWRRCNDPRGEHV